MINTIRILHWLNTKLRTISDFVVVLGIGSAMQELKASMRAPTRNRIWIGTDKEFRLKKNKRRQPPGIKPEFRKNKAFTAHTTLYSLPGPECLPYTHMGSFPRVHVNNNLWGLFTTCCCKLWVFPLRDQREWYSSVLPATYRAVWKTANENMGTFEMRWFRNFFLTIPRHKPKLRLPTILDVVVVLCVGS